MSTSYVGEIRCFGFSFAPYGWAFCNGQLMSIDQNTALFTILGTFYGGDGQSTFALPNLQGRIPMHWGSTPSIGTTVIGEVQGVTNVTLTTQEIPQHSHTISGAETAVGAPAEERTANPSAAAFLGASTPPNRAYQAPPVTLGPTFSPKAIGLSGNSIPHDNMQPYLALNFCVSLYGIFPSQG